MRTAHLRHLAAALVMLAVAVACTSDDGGDGEEGGAPAGAVVGEGDTYEATIRRDAAGVPHITAADLASLSFGQGWASAEDRACDLADQVVKISSERARWHGAGEDDEHLQSDISWHAIGIRDLAADDWAEASPEVIELITAYTDGWNAHLAEVGVEGLSDWCAGEPWVRPLEPVEVYAYARSVALQASSGAVAGLMATAQPPGGAPAEDDEPDEDGDASSTTTTPAGDEGDGDAGEGSTTTAPDDGDTTTSTAPDDGDTTTSAPGSNGWAIGSDRSESGGGMLVANPHFPWEGQLRFWEVHLTIPDQVDIYGVQLSGLPGVGIGFTEEFGWTHTVSAGNRFTAYRLDLVEGDPTSYVYGEEEREMTAEEVDIEVLGDDGELTTETRTVWRSHYGPILDFPGFGWTEAATITLRDANIDNDEFIEQYLAMMQAEDFDAFVDVHRDITGVPLFNTIATSADGRAYYADTSATPKLSEEALAAYEASLQSDPIVGIAADNGAILLDGSDPRFEWEEVEGARDPGLVPYAEMPVLERSDYVFNANDSFWVAHATELLEGDYSPLHGRQGTARSPRTRENAVVLDTTASGGASGEDGLFTLDELADAAVANRGYTSRALLDEVVDRCLDAAPVTVEPLVDDDGNEVLGGGEIAVADACAVLADWDGRYDIDRAGPPLWRELMSRYERDAFLDAGPLWAEPFDATNPIGTPTALAPPPADGPDPLLVNLARAVQVLEVAGFEPDVTLGEAQVAVRGDVVVPIHGGDSRDGTTNIVGFGRGWDTLDPYLADVERDTVAPDSSLADASYGDTDVSGYLINNGTSFMMALAYGEDGPEAKVFLTYGNTADRSDPLYAEATEAFSEKAWRTVAFTADAVDEAAVDTTTVRG